MVTYYSASGAKIVLSDTPLSSGGEGDVYAIVSPSNYDGYCAKIYKAGKKNLVTQRNKIDFMVTHPPANVLGSKFKICWPKDLILDSKKTFLGFIMPLAFTDSVTLYELTAIKFSKKTSNAWGKFERASATGMEKRFGICNNIALAIDSIHKSGNYSLVDYKPQNILITHTGSISIIDVDSFQISDKGKVLHHAAVFTEDYAPPEYDAIKLNPATAFIPQSWDLFSLAISFYEIFFGIHPFTGSCKGQYANLTTNGERIKNGLFVHSAAKKHYSVIPDIHENFENLPNSIATLFKKCFEDGHKCPNSRPTAQQWGHAIFTEILNKNIKGNNVVMPLKQNKTLKQARQQTTTNTAITVTTVPPIINPPHGVPPPIKKSSLFVTFLIVVLQYLLIYPLGKFAIGNYIKIILYYCVWIFVNVIRLRNANYKTKFEKTVLIISILTLIYATWYAWFFNLSIRQLFNY